MFMHDIMGLHSCQLHMLFAHKSLNMKEDTLKRKAKLFVDYIR